MLVPVPLVHQLDYVTIRLFEKEEVTHDLNVSFLGYPLVLACTDSNPEEF